MKQLCDVIVIGGGVVGSAITRGMSRYRLKIGVLEESLDVCYETSDGNSSVVHDGFTYDTGSLKARLCVESGQFMEQLAEELDFEFIRCGKVLVGNTAEDMETLRQTTRQGEESGAAGLEFIEKEWLHQLVPAVAGESIMFLANSRIADPFNYIIALTENAHANETAYYSDHEVTRIWRDSQGNYTLTTLNGEFYTRQVVNSVGLGCGKISGMLDIRGYKVIGPKGGYIILGKRTEPLLPVPVYPAPSNTYVGIHVTNTADSNVIIGPNAGMVADSTYYGVPWESMDYLTKSASDLWSRIHKKDYIRSYSGILPKWVDENSIVQDFEMEIGDDIAPRAINLVGIESPGLTAAVPIARHTVCPMEERGKLTPNPEFSPVGKGIPCFAEMTKEEQGQMIRQNPNYGQVVCRCGKITRAEVLAVIYNPLGVDIIAGIKYRTRSMMEWCQGGYYQIRTAQVIEEESGKKETEIRYARKDSQMLFGRVREEVQGMEIDVPIVGGGPAGLAATTRLHRKGVHNILIMEREKQLGGIPRQCIHDGFGPTRFKAALSGPEYAQRLIDEMEGSGIPYITDAIMLEVTEDRTVTATTRQGLKVWKARSVILTMECRERARSTLGVPGERPAGAFTAGVAQAYINLYNVMSAREIVILGPGNIGTIMARRFMLEGVHVQAVLEIQSYPNGPPRNAEWCLNDYGIPLYPGHTVTAVHGNNRLVGVMVSRVDEHLRPVPRTEKEHKCGTLILSVGLTPENELSLDAGITLDDRTKDAVMDEYFQTDVEGIFAAGNVLHVHDLVDFVSTEAESLADSAAEHVQNGCLTPRPIEIETDSHINHTVPQGVSGTRDFKLFLGVNSPLKERSTEVRQDGVLVALKKMKKAVLAEMIGLTVKVDKLVSLSRLETSVGC